MRHLAYAPDHDGRATEQWIIMDFLRAEDGTCRTRRELGHRLPCHDPKAIDNALACLTERGVLRLTGESIECPDSFVRRAKLDALSGVVVHVLVRAYPQTLTVAQVAQECERDLANPEEREEIELSLRWIMGDDLAYPQEDGWQATRAAVRATELSF